MKVLVLSPHMDDAIFSCSAFAIDLLKKNYDVDVLTIFTKFGTSQKQPQHIKEYLSASGFSSIDYFAKARTEEDKGAFKFLNLKNTRLSYIDGGFRKSDTRNLYPHRKSLFSGNINIKDNSVIKKLKEELSLIVYKYDIVISPLAVGKHIDHIITKLAIQDVLLPHVELYYYFDFPYTLKLKNLEISHLQKLFKLKYFNLFGHFHKKKCAMRFYNSQFKLFYQDMSFIFPEIIVSSK